MKLQLLKDIHDNDYIGFDITGKTCDKHGVFLSDMIQIADSKITNFRNCNLNLFKRNGNKYHMTLSNTMEMPMVRKSNLDIINIEFSNDIFEYAGIGSISINSKVTYFVIIKSEYFNNIRTDVGLNEKDLHVTIGYTDKDLFHDRKNIANIWKPL